MILGEKDAASHGKLAKYKMNYQLKVFVFLINNESSGVMEKEK